MTDHDEPFDLSRTFVHLGCGSTATPLPDFAWTPEYLESYRDQFAADGDDGRLVCVIAQEATWDGWERHPAGEEVVFLLSGRVDLVQELEGAEHVIELHAGRSRRQPGQRLAHGPRPRAWACALHHSGRGHRAPAARLTTTPQRTGARSCGPCGGYPPASRMARPQGASTPISSSQSSPSAPSMAPHWASVATSIDSRSVRPVRRQRATRNESPIRQPRLRTVELFGGPGAGPHVGAHREAPIELGQQPDLRGVETGGRPRRGMGVAPVLTQRVGQAPHVADRIARQPEAQQPGEKWLALRPQRRRRRRPAAGSHAPGRRAADPGCAPVVATAPRVRASQMVGASTLLHPNSTAGTTAAGLNTANAAATTSPGTWPMTEPRLVK